MRTLVQWRLMFRAGDQPAFDKCVAQVVPLYGPGAEIGEGKPYWKIPELWECEVVSRVRPGTTADQILGCLLTAYELASGWYIFGDLSQETAVGFTGVFARGDSGASTRLSGLEWASFEVVEESENVRRHS